MMSGDITPYTDLITNEHADKPNFVATVSTSVQPFADISSVLASLPDSFDVDKAIGAQLDIIGLWVGRSRFLTTPLTGVYFSLDTIGVGFDQGVWIQPFDPTTGLVVLPDDAYRTLIKATIAANQWDGTKVGAYNAWNILFSAQRSSVIIQDDGVMAIIYGLIGPQPDAVTLALFENGLLNLKPAGVRVTYYFTPTVDSVPYFGFDVESNAISGFDVGAWGKMTAGS